MNCTCLKKSLIFNNKVTDAFIDLPSDIFKKLYEGQRRGRLLVLNFERISPNLFSFQVRDLIHRDHFVCQKEENMSAMVPGDLVDSEDSICIQVPEISRFAILLGPVKIVARWKEASWSHLPDTIPLPPHYFSIN